MDGVEHTTNGSPRTPAEDIHALVNAVDADGNIIGVVQRIEPWNQWVAAIPRLPIQRDVKIRRGRRFDHKHLDAIYERGEAKGIKWLSCMIQAVGEIQSKRCKSCDKNQGAFEQFVIVGGDLLQKCDNCEQAHIEAAEQLERRRQEEKRQEEKREEAKREEEKRVELMQQHQRKHEEAQRLEHERLEREHQEQELRLREQQQHSEKQARMKDIRRKEASQMAERERIRRERERGEQDRTEKGRNVDYVDRRKAACSRTHWLVRRPSPHSPIGGRRFAPALITTAHAIMNCRRAVSRIWKPCSNSTASRPQARQPWFHPSKYARHTRLVCRALADTLTQAQRGQSEVPLAEITKEDLVLRHNGSVYTYSECMFGVPLVKIHPGHTYWEPNWKDVRFDIIASKERWVMKHAAVAKAEARREVSGSSKFQIGRGGRRDAIDENELGVGKLWWTSFYIACVQNKDDVHRFDAKPVFRVIDVVDRHGIWKENIEYLNRHGYFVRASFTTPIQEFNIFVDAARKLQPAELFGCLSMVEVIGAGFDKPANTGYYTLRFPRVLKIHQDRSLKNAVSFEELQQMAPSCQEVIDCALLRRELRSMAHHPFFRVRIVYGAKPSC